MYHLNKEYKYSKYNFFLEYENFILAFNSLSGSLLRIPLNLFTELNHLNCEISEVEVKSKDLYNALIESRFIIPNEVNELSIIKLRNKHDVFLDNFYNLILCPTMECNFRCWYCYQSHNQGRMSNVLLMAIKRYVKLLIKEHKISGLALSWFGGEPLLYFKEMIYPLSVDILKSMRRNQLQFYHSITTNGYLIDNEMIKKFNEIELKHFQITLDGNENSHNKSRVLKRGGKTFNKIVENINLICKDINKAEITLRINYKDETIQDLNEIIDLIPFENRHKISLDFQRIWQTTGKTETDHASLYSQVKIFQNAGFHMPLSSVFQINKGHSCYADRFYEAIINYDGYVYKCTARDFKIENSYGKLEKNGEIKWKNDLLSKRLANATFENEKCIECKYLPICIGPCTQTVLEEGEIKRTCRLNTNEITINDFIITKYKAILQKQI